MKKLFILLTLPLLLSGCASVPTPGATPAPAAPTPAQTPAPAASASEKTASNDPDTVKATITMADGGVIELELYPKIAPQSVYNFASLARSGFYDGLIFHRVINGFMIQGGDPDGTGMGGPGYNIKGEFAVNGVDNPIKHERGVLSMARKGDPMYNSAGSQFFIMHQTNPSLDGAYAAFGRVTSGIEVVDRIASTPVGANDRPRTDVVIQSITIDGPELPEPEKLS